MADYNDIKQSIATNLPDNNRREITAARLRDTLNGFVDKVQETETGIEGKVSTNESNIGNLSGRMDTNEANVTNLTGRVDSLEQTVENLPSGEAVKVVDNLGFGGAKDAVSAKWVNAVAALAGMGMTETNKGNDFVIGKVTTIKDGYCYGGEVTQREGYCYFEYNLQFENGYVTICANGGTLEYPTPEGNYMRGDFCLNGAYTSAWGYNTEQYPSGVFPLELQVPYNVNMIHANLIKGTFDPDNLYVIESRVPSSQWKLNDMDNEIHKYLLPTNYKAQIGEDSQLSVEPSGSISVVKLLKNDELEVDIKNTWGAKLAIGESDNIHYPKTIIYQNEQTIKGWIYYKADKDCYAFISGGGLFKLKHNDYFDNDLQDQMNALIKKIKPSFGEVVLDASGKGLYDMLTSGTKIVCKVPIIAGSTLNYTLHSTGTFTLGPVAYYYNGQPVATESIEHQATFGENVLGIVGGTKSGYMLVTFVYSGGGDISAEIFNATYLEKNAQ